MARGAGVQFYILLLLQRFFWNVAVIGFSVLAWIMIAVVIARHWNGDPYINIALLTFLGLPASGLFGLIRRIARWVAGFWRGEGESSDAAVSGGLTLFSRVCMTVFGGSWLLALLMIMLALQSATAAFYLMFFALLLVAILLLSWQG